VNNVAEISEACHYSNFLLSLIIDQETIPYLFIRFVLDIEESYLCLPLFERAFIHHTHMDTIQDFISVYFIGALASVGAFFLFYLLVALIYRYHHRSFLKVRKSHPLQGNSPKLENKSRRIILTSHPETGSGANFICEEELESDTFNLRLPPGNYRHHFTLRDRLLMGYLDRGIFYRLISAGLWVLYAILIGKVLYTLVPQIPDNTGCAFVGFAAFFLAFATAESILLYLRGFRL